MYKAFNLYLEENYERWYGDGETVYRDSQKKIHSDLANYLHNETHILNGNTIESDWFPLLNNVDVFLSHSHKDEQQIIGFAGWLHKTFGLNVFIDSCLWNHSEDLLRLIDNRYCYDSEKNTYDYHKRNYSTSHVHMMLSMALTKMIDRSETVIFVESKNSIHAISETIDKTTKSPWIYNELVITNLVRKREPNRKMDVMLEKRAQFEANQLDISYDVGFYLNNLLPLKKENLKLWEAFYSKNLQSGVHPLDVLYTQYEKKNSVLLG